MVGAGLLLGAAAGEARGQRTPDQKITSATMGWRSKISPMLEVEAMRVWRVKMQYPVGASAEVIGTTARGCPIYAGATEGGIFVPVFAMGATHTTFPRSLLASFEPLANVCSAAKITDAGWLGEPAGAQAYYGWALEADAGLLTLAGLAKVESELVARRVKPDVEAILAMPWWEPEEEPLDAREALGKQVYLERGVDPETRLVRDLRGIELDQRARRFMTDGRIRQPRDVTPGKLVQEVAKRVLTEIRITHDGVALVQGARACGVKVVASEFDNSEMALALRFGGFDVRDALTVLREGRGTRVERAMVLATVLKQLGVPARLVVGFDADPGDGSDDTPLRTRRVRRAPELLPWVEFGLVEAGKGVTHWIPIDPGISGSGHRFGYLEDGENRVPVSSALWHPQTEMVGNPDQCWESDLHAGMWGFWSVGRRYRGQFQSLSLLVVEPSVNEVRDGVRRPRSVAMDVDPFDAEAQAQAEAEMAASAGGAAGDGARSSGTRTR